MQWTVAKIQVILDGILFDQLMIKELPIVALPNWLQTMVLQQLWVAQLHCIFLSLATGYIEDATDPKNTQYKTCLSQELFHFFWCHLVFGTHDKWLKKSKHWIHMDAKMACESSLSHQNGFTCSKNMTGYTPTNYSFSPVRSLVRAFHRRVFHDLPKIWTCRLPLWIWLCMHSNIWASQQGLSST